MLTKEDIVFYLQFYDVSSIQEKWKPKEGDFCIHFDTQNYTKVKIDELSERMKQGEITHDTAGFKEMFWTGDPKEDAQEYFRYYHLWIPSKEQIIELLGDKRSGLLSNLQEFKKERSDIKGLSFKEWLFWFMARIRFNYEWSSDEGCYSWI